MDKDLIVSEIDNILHVRMADPTREEMCWNNDIGGPSEDLVYYYFKGNDGLDFGVTIAAAKYLSEKPDLKDKILFKQ